MVADSRRPGPPEDREHVRSILRDLLVRRAAERELELAVGEDARHAEHRGVAAGEVVGVARGDEADELSLDDHEAADCGIGPPEPRRRPIRRARRSGSRAGARSHAWCRQAARSCRGGDPRDDARRPSRRGSARQTAPAAPSAGPSRRTRRRASARSRARNATSPSSRCGRRVVATGRSSESSVTNTESTSPIAVPSGTSSFGKGTGAASSASACSPSPSRRAASGSSDTSAAPAAVSRSTRSITVRPRRR